MDNNNIILDAFNSIIADFKETIGVEDLQAHFIITPNMDESYRELRDLNNDSENSPKQSLNHYNGLTVQPKEPGGCFTILLNQQYLLESLKSNNFYWIGTIAHEASHVNDFQMYYKLVQPEVYDELFDFGKHRMFLHWTEFRAKAIGYFFIRKNTFSDLYDRRQLYDICNTELPFHINNLIRDVSQTKNADEQLYVAMHFLGRLAVWQYFFPLDFNSNAIHSMLEANPWMEEMYHFLVEHGTLEKAYPAFNEMEDILNRHFG